MLLAIIFIFIIYKFILPNSPAKIPIVVKIIYGINSNDNKSLKSFFKLDNFVEFILNLKNIINLNNT
jgi:hypothetical protein